ncbi:MAG: hypothetical protein NTZ63_01435 [Candidatus Omnitrophica bacterium]|nr:hypothetical protein [Candidatus Omnitrophota bacterium]
MNWAKISKLGLLLAIVNAAIVITIAYLDSLNTSRGFGLVAILGMEIPATFVIMPLSDFIDNIYKVSPFILIPALASILGGLQWYGIGWLISKLISKTKK